MTFLAVAGHVLSWYEAVPREVRKRKALGELDNNLRTPKKKQIFHIVHDEAYYKADPRPEFQKPLSRNKAIVKNQLTNDHIKARVPYCRDEIQLYYYTNYIIICYDEKGWKFRGSGDKRITVLRGAKPYTFKQLVRFLREVWCAAYSKDTSVTRPIVIWDVESTDYEGL
ncbi:hypothetical protein TI39_contig961g00012 [Zymoseptoria brevis]|uniref:Uncharacterized protein n=1 Tax=Zymoseptoria brevis TaxID=1047168 RepID=A0A0F4GI41_9PEZI|nr:hypothetical protein TI39_contig961g00012 [Zymoseptoria brevis]